MTTKIKTIHLLIIDPSSNEAEKTINILRNAGYAVRATAIQSEEELQEALEKQHWDLFLSKNKGKEIDATQAFKIVQHYGKDIPFLLLLDDYTVEKVADCMGLGMHAVVPANHQEVIRLHIIKELTAAADRFGRRKAEHSLGEAEIRCNLLLQSSRDAIAYVHDGMHIYTNDAYAELFGYDDLDEIACMPVMDMVDGDYKEGLKQFLKDKSNNNNEDFAFKGIKEDGSRFNAYLQTSSATYDGEDCTQILIRLAGNDQELEQKLKELSAVDQVTGLYNRQYFFDTLTHASNEAANGRENYVLICLEVDQIGQIKSDFGIPGTDELAQQTGKFLSEQNIDAVVLAHVSDETFCALMKCSKPDDAKRIGAELCENFKEQLIDVQGRTIPCTLSLGMVLITEKAPDANTIFNQAHQTCLRIRKGQGDNARLYNPAFEQAAGGSNAELVEKIQDALESGNMFLTYQPIAKLHGENQDYYQALLRMNNDDGDLVSPSELFPLTNQSGISTKLDRWVIAQAMRTINVERKKGKATKLFVQLSGGSLVDEAVTNFIITTLKKIRLPADSLIFQFHETDAAAYLKRAIAFVNTLHQHGMKVAMSGFGSSLDPDNIFSHLDIDIVILDESFTADLFSDTEINNKVTELVNAAHTKDKITVVPAVDDASSLAALYPLGVKYIQGDYLQAPSRELEFDFDDSEF